MSCADVCVYQDADGCAELSTIKIVTARKTHRCCECGGEVAAGQQYERSSGKFDGFFSSEATCLVCVEIRKAFVCGSWVVGMLWESVTDELFPRWLKEGPFECMAKLATPEARDYCLKRFNGWNTERDA